MNHASQRAATSSAPEITIVEDRTKVFHERLAGIQKRAERITPSRIRRPFSPAAFSRILARSPNHPGRFVTDSEQHRSIMGYLRESRLRRPPNGRHRRRSAEFFRTLFKIEWL